MDVLIVEDDQEQLHLYAAMKKGICKNKEVTPLKTYVGL